MAFGYIKYVNDEKRGVLGGIKRLLGISSFEKMKGFEGRGFIITLPYEKYDDNLKLREKANRKMFKRLEKAGINILCSDDTVNCPYGFTVSRGDLVAGAFLGEIVDDAAQKEGISIEDNYITLKDGGGDESIYALEALSSKAGEMGILTQRYNDIEPFLERIYYEKGLAINAFSYEESQSVKKSQIIINCGRQIEKSPVFKRGALYIFMCAQRDRAHMLLEKRQDLKIYSSPQFKLKGDLEPLCAIEAYLMDLADERGGITNLQSFAAFAAENGVEYAEIKALKGL